MVENRWEGFDITGKKKANSSKVSSDISREDISATAKKPTGVLDYKGDDDLWVVMDGNRVVVDVGGIHDKMDGKVEPSFNIMQDRCCKLQCYCII